MAIGLLGIVKFAYLALIPVRGGAWLAAPPVLWAVGNCKIYLTLIPGRGRAWLAAPPGRWAAVKLTLL